jgi:ParB family chromosome partitioning protein
MVQSLKVELVDPNPFQQRKDFDPADIRELADSIKRQGLLQPITVRPNPKQDGRFEIIGGERRLRATKHLKRGEIQAIVRTDINDEQMEELALIENVQRKDLSLIEEANGYQRLMERCNGDIDQVVLKVGKGKQTVQERLELLDLQPEVQGMVDTRQLSLEQAKVLLTVNDREQQITLAKNAARMKLDANKLKGLVQTKAKNSSGSDKDGASKVRFDTVNRQLIQLADSLERLDLSTCTAEQLKTLQAQLTALTEQAKEDILPKVTERLRGAAA